MNVSQETEIETEQQCKCELGPGAAATPSFASSAVEYIFPFFSSRRRDMCCSEEEIHDEMRFGWHAPDQTGCHTGFYEKGHPDAQKLLEKCLPPYADGPAMYLIGDSHAFVVHHGLKKASSIPVYHASWQCWTDAKQRTDVFPEHLRSVVKEDDIIVFLSTSLSYKAHVNKFLALAKEKQLKMILLGDYPVLHNEPGLCYHKSKPGSLTMCSLLKSRWTNSVIKKENNDFAKQAVAANPGMVFFHDLTDDMCPGTKCDMWIPGTAHPAYMDQHHINRAAGSYLAQSLCTFLNKKGLYKGGRSQEVVDRKSVV